MPRYKVSDPESGLTATLEGDSPPTEAELVDVFSVLDKRVRPSAQASIPAPGKSTEGRAPVSPLTEVPQAFPVEQQQREAVAAIPKLTGAEAEQLAMSPQMQIPQPVKQAVGSVLAAGVPGGQVPQIRKLIQGPVNAALGGAEFMTAPAAGPIAAAQAVPFLNTTVDAVLAASMLKSGAGKIREAAKTGDLTLASEGTSEAVMGALAGVGAVNTVFPPKAKPPPMPMLRRSEAELSKIPGERKADASAISETAEVHGNVRSQPVEGERQVPVEESGAGVQPQAERRVQEARPDDTGTEAQAKNLPRNVESKPAPVVSEQAPQTEAPTAAAVSEAEPTGVAAPAEPPAISEPTIPPSSEQPIGRQEVKPTAEPTTATAAAGQVEPAAALRAELKSMLPGLTDRQATKALFEPWDDATRAQFDKLPEADKSKIEQWFVDNEQRINQARTVETQAVQAQTLQNAAQTGEDTLATELVAKLRKLANQPKSEETRAEATRLMQDAAKAASDAGLDREKIKTAVAGEFSKIYGADAAEMVEATFGKQAETPKQAAAPPGPGLVGMGGAVPEEFKPSGQTATAIKNAAIENDRVRMGLPKFEPVARQRYKEEWDTAMSLIDRDPTIQDKLIADLKVSPRALKDNVETALLHHRMVDLKNEFAKATRDLSQGTDDQMPDVIRSANDRIAMLSDKLLELTDVTKSVGKEWGRTGVGRQQWVDDAFELTNMVNEKRAARGGAPLNKDEVLELKKQADTYAKLNAELQTRLDQRETQLRERESQQAFLEAQAKAKASGKVSDYVLQTAEKWVKRWGEEAAVARKELAGKFLSPSPKDLLNLAKIIRFRIGEIGLDAARITAELVTEFGEAVRPYIEGAIKTAQDMIDRQGTGLPSEVRDRVKATVTKTAPTIDTIKDKLRAKVEKGQTANLTPLTKKLAEMLWDQGVRTHDAMIDSLRGILNEFVPGISRQDTMDALSGRGRFTLPSQDATKKGVRDLSTQARLIAHQIDVEAKKPLPRTGFQPDKMSDAARREQQRLNELKRKFGVTVTDPAAQLATALQQAKTYLRNRMADLRQEIATRERIVSQKTPLKPDAELEAMRKEYDQIKKDHEAIFPREKRNVTDEQRIAIANRALDRSIAALEADLKAGVLNRPKALSKTPSTPELEAKRARLEALRDQRQELRDLANPKATPLERALQARKTRLTNRVAELQEKIAAGDFTVKPKRTPPTDREVERLQFQVENLQRTFYEGLLEEKLRNRTIPEKLYGGAREGLNAVRAIVTSADLSAVLRQGKFIVLAHPLRGASSIPAMLRAFRSEAAQLSVQRQIESRPNYPLYRASKLYLSEHGASLSKMEEAYMSRWAGKLPVVGPMVKASERAYTTFLNKLRADSFDAMASKLAKGREVTIEEARLLSNFINVATGRGTIGMAEQAAVGLNTVFFAPRYVASRFQLVLGQPLYYGLLSGKAHWTGTQAARRLVAMEYGRILAGAAVVYALGTASGADIEVDPRSSDFGKMRFGNTRIDPMAGVNQVTVLLSRLASGKKKTLTGNIVPIRGENVPYKGDRSFDIISRFARMKLAPAPGTVIDALSGTDAIGQPVTIGSLAQRVTVPISLSDIYQTMQEQGIPAGLAISVLSIFGESVQNFDVHKQKGQ